MCLIRAPEDQRFELTLDITNRGLRFPLKINGNQICPEMAQLPIESEDWTEMSLFLIQTESYRQLHPVMDTREQRSADTLPAIAAERRMIQKSSQYVSTR